MRGARGALGDPANWIWCRGEAGLITRDTGRLRRKVPMTRLDTPSNRTQPCLERQIRRIPGQFYADILLSAHPSTSGGGKKTIGTAYCWVEEIGIALRAGETGTGAGAKRRRVRGTQSILRKRVSVGIARILVYSGVHGKIDQGWSKHRNEKSI